MMLDRVPSSWRVFPVALACAAFALSSCSCEQRALPDPPPECDAEGNGCLSDEQCVHGKCVPMDACEDDSDCPSSAWRCVFPTQICELRPGFGEECQAPTDCPPSHFCALGVCRDLETARPCSRRSDCALGQACDRVSFLCIPEGPCTLAEEYPELECDPGEVCEAFSGRCSLECQEECTPETELEDCGAGYRCDGACRCVQCLTDDDCGPGLVCNQRAGRCESENLCYEDSDCAPPLVCDPRTALCQVPPPPCESDLDCEIAEICNRSTGECELPGGECIDDRFEDADTPAAAEEVVLLEDGTPRVLDELVLCPDDDDVYALPLRAGDNLVARIYGSATQARATIWLLDSEGETSVRFAEAPPYGNGTISYVAQVDETVFLRVNALLGQTPYELELLRAPGTPCGPDAFEGQGGNDTLETATPPNLVPLNTTLLARICPEDVDHLRIDLGAGEGIDATLDFDETKTDLDLFVLDAATGAVLTRSAGVRSPEHVRYRSPLARSVVVKVQGFANHTGSYSLALTYLPAFSCSADPEEPDDAPESATELPLNASIEGLVRTLCAGDQDLYRVPLEDFQRIVVDAAFSTAELDLEINILDDVGENVLRTSPNSTGGETLTYDAQGDETVLVELKALRNTAGPYTLSLFRENQIACEPDALEPNDTGETAVPLPADAGVLTLCSPDEDLFTVGGVANKRLIARASFLHADGDIDLMVLGTDGAQVLGSSDGVGNQEEVEVLLPVDGTYFVRVFSLTSGARSRYRLEVELAD